MREFLYVARVGLGGTRATIPLPARKKFLAKPSKDGAGKKRGFGKRNSRPARAKIIKNQRPDFREKKFGFCSKDPAAFDETNSEF